MKQFNDKQKMKVAIWIEANVDTDKIIPKGYLKGLTAKGYGKYLFDNLRFKEEVPYGILPEGREVNSDFFLNQEENQNAEILISGENFGCGSSREHAVWAFIDYGFKIIIAPSFGDIFYENSFKNGLLLITLTSDQISFIIQHMNKSSLTINLEEKKILVAQRTKIIFELDTLKQKNLLQGRDEISDTLSEHGEQITTFKQQQIQIHPWM